MPVTARLSRRFYERLGDEIANELVDWLNAVDATYRSDLRETNELNFARFMAAVNQRFAEQDVRFERRFVELEARFEKRLGELDARFGQRFSDLDIVLEQRFGGIDSRFPALRADLLKWMFVYWTGTVIAIGGLLFGMLR